MQKYRLGVTHDNNEDFAAAIEAYKAFVKAVSSSSSPEAGIHTCLGLNAIAISSQCLGELAMCLAYHAEHAKSAPDVRNRALALCNAGLVHRQLGNLADSDACFTQALTMAQDAEDGPMSVLAAGHVGVNATLCLPDDAPPPPPSIAAHARVAHSRIPAGFRASVTDEAKARERAAGGARRRHVPTAFAPAGPPALPSEAAAEEATRPAGRIPRALAEAVSAPRSGLPPTRSLPASAVALALVSTAGRRLEAGLPPRTMAITQRDRPAWEVGQRMADARGEAAAKASPSGGGGDAAGTMRRIASCAERKTTEGHVGSEEVEEAMRIRAAERQARLDTGEAALTEAAGMLAASDDPCNGPTILAGLATVAAARGSYDEAEKRFAAAAWEAAEVAPASAALYTCCAAVAAAEGLLPGTLAARAEEAEAARQAHAVRERLKAKWAASSAARRAGREAEEAAQAELLLVRASCAQQEATDAAASVVGGVGKQ